MSSTQKNNVSSACIHVSLYCCDGLRCCSEALGLYSIELCNDCPAGTYSDVTGATSLKTCTVSPLAYAMLYLVIAVACNL
jgi:hypothetical protein